MANSTDATPEQLRDIIIDTYKTLVDYQSQGRAAKKAYNEAVAKLPAATEVQNAQAVLDNAKEKLKSIVQTDADLQELAEDAKYYNSAISSAKATLSNLLVKQATRSKNASVDIGEAVNHEIILTAKLGQEAPEQLDLFDDEADDEQ